MSLSQFHVYSNNECGGFPPSPPSPADTAERHIKALSRSEYMHAHCTEYNTFPSFHTVTTVINNAAQTAGFDLNKCISSRQKKESAAENW